MKREIKFRAWDNKSKLMIDSQFGNWLSFDGIPYEEANRKFDTPHIEIEKSKDLILMQFTGLLDKNGKEIYEGDIVIVKFAGSIPLNVYIDFNSHGAVFQIRYPQMRSEIGAKETWVSDHLFRYSNDIEVIDNIYQNKDFTKNKFGNA